MSLETCDNKDISLLWFLAKCLLRHVDIVRARLVQFHARHSATRSPICRAVFGTPSPGTKMAPAPHMGCRSVPHHAILFDAALPAPVPSAGAARRASVGATPNRPLLVFGTASIYVFQLYSKNSTRAAPPIFGILEHWPPQFHGVSYSRKS